MDMTRWDIFGLPRGEISNLADLQPNNWLKVLGNVDGRERNAHDFRAFFPGASCTIVFWIACHAMLINQLRPMTAKDRMIHKTRNPFSVKMIDTVWKQA